MRSFGLFTKAMETCLLRSWNACATRLLYTHVCMHAILWAATHTHGCTITLTWLYQRDPDKDLLTTLDGMFGVASLVWNLSVEIFRSRNVVWNPSLGNFRCGTFAWDLLLGISLLATFGKS